MANTASFNQAIEAWSIRKASAMNAQMSAMGIVDTGNLFRTLRARVRTFLGEADSIGFKMPRYGILVEKGAGRGTNLGGSRNKRTSVSRQSSNRAAFSLITRKPKPWFSNVLNDQAIRELADIMIPFKWDQHMDKVADVVSKEIFARIKVRK